MTKIKINYYYIITFIIGLLTLIQPNDINKDIGIILLSVWCGILSIEISLKNL